MVVLLRGMDVEGADSTAGYVCELLSQVASVVRCSLPRRSYFRSVYGPEEARAASRFLHVENVMSFSGSGMLVVADDVAEEPFRSALGSVATLVVSLVATDDPSVIDATKVGTSGVAEVVGEVYRSGLR